MTHTCTEACDTHVVGHCVSEYTYTGISNQIGVPISMYVCICMYVCIQLTKCAKESNKRVQAIHCKVKVLISWDSQK